MDLIVTERGKTHAAYLRNEEWTIYGTTEDTLERVLAYIRTQRALNPLVNISPRIDSDNVVVDFINGIDVVTSQLIIDCNPCDREELFARLRGACR